MIACFEIHTQWLTVCRVPRLNLGNVLDNDDNVVDYTIAMESPLVAAAAGYGYCSHFCLTLSS